MPEDVIIKRFDNGLTLLIEPMVAVRSTAFSLQTPGGCIYEAPGMGGTAAVLADVITRGAGSRNSREYSDALDRLGAHTSESAGWGHLSLTGRCLGESLHETLSLVADAVRQPHLDEAEFGPAISGLEQSLRGIEDEPQRKLGIELRRRIYPEPWGRSPDGNLDDLPRLTHANVRRHWETCVGPRGAVLGIAGNVDVERLIAHVEDLFGDWQDHPLPSVLAGPRGALIDHISVDSAQTHIGLAFDAANYREDAYFAAWAAISVLGGGSSSRLFTNVREHRGLCYSIYASLSTTPTAGRAIIYAGTTNERAQETLDLSLEELVRLTDDLTDEELQRCKAQAKSALVMQQESTGSRASSLAKDWIYLERVRPLEEVRSAIDRLTVNDLRDELHSRGTKDLTLLTIGPEPLTMAALATR